MNNELLDETGAYTPELPAGASMWEGEVPAAPIFVRDFSGPAGECTAVLTHAGKTRAQALAIVNNQIAIAIRMLRVAATRLKRGSRSNTTRQLFRKIFRVSPEFVPSWLKQTATIKDRGDVVAVRCRRVADLLASGRIRYFCRVTAANCPDCGNDNSPFACSSWGAHNVICLGDPFWDDMRNNRITSILATLMHEPFHIYFGEYVTEHHQHPDGRSVGKFGGIYCILQFVFGINGRTPPQRVSDRCRDTVVRSETSDYEQEEAEAYSASNWEGETGAAPPRYVRDFWGPNAECTAALTQAGKTRAQALAIINAEIHSAIRMLRVAATKLKRGNRSTQTKAIFKKIFRVQPSFVPTWLKPTNAVKDRGDVVGVRCKRVADLLASGRIRFFCRITATNCPDCGSDNSPFACSSWGQESTAPQNGNVICLGSATWNDMRNNNRASIRSTVMHEPFHIYFGIYVTEHGQHGDGSSVGKFGGIDCIVRFVFEVNGQTPVPTDVTACNAVTVRSELASY